MGGYHPGMADAPDGTVFIEGRVTRKVSNALRIEFRSGPGDPFAVGTQSGGDGTGTKLAILFGFKNGGTGRHALSFVDGHALWVASTDGGPTVLGRPDGVEVATVHRGDTSTAVRAGGGTLFEFVPDPDDPVTLDLYRLVVRDPSGAELGRLDVVRRTGGWTVGKLLQAAYDEYVLWDQTGRALKVPLQGTRLALRHPVDDLARDVLLGACVDLAIGLRPYVAAMR